MSREKELGMWLQHFNSQMSTIKRRRDVIVNTVKNCEISFPGELEDIKWWISHAKETMSIALEAGLTESDLKERLDDIYKLDDEVDRLHNTFIKNCKCMKK